MTATLTRTPSPTSSVHRAVRDILPIAASVLPFGTVVGATLVQADVVGVPGLAGTALLYAGSAQLATLSVLIAGGGPAAAVLAGAIVNSRLLLYSAGMSTRFQGQPPWFRWLAPLTTVDQTFALAMAADDLDRPAFRRYWVTL
ncbi:MAG TPA: AzlC family ABC transporter permease, partial [Euzebya sp.]|nr:AzlC family ABC transporter permease [Euzebya sp.]